MTTLPPELSALDEALHGQYAIQRELGRGGMGIVLLAHDVRLDRLVALKVLPPALALQQETRERFLREARTAAQLSHPNIVPIYRADEMGGFAFFAMGYVDGETLADRIRDRGTLPVVDVVRFMREVAWALAYAHARGIVHRDVKPENILVERATGRAIVTDFGIARAEFNPSLTADGHVLGTVHYMSPEQAMGEPIDGRSDLYALGCIGYLACSGRLPFDGSTPQAVLVAHATREAAALRSVAPHVPATLAAVIDRCLAKHPDARFTSGEELAEVLAKALDEASQVDQDSGSVSVLNSDEAMVVWRRAAELQAEAAARLESRMRDTRSIAPVSASEPSPAPTDAYKLRDVEATAVEAGISQKFVALAVAELKASPHQAIQRAQGVPEWKERLATRMLGTTQRSLSTSRVFRHPPRIVLQALGRTLQGAPYMLELKDTLGGHPLDGGVLVFKFPDMTMENYKFTWSRYGVYVKEMRVSIATVPGDARACEVTLQADLREGLNANLIGYGGVAAMLATGGGAAAAAIAFKTLLLSGAALLAPALGVAAVVGLGTLAVAGPVYRWEIRSATKEFQNLLTAVETAIRSLDIFGEVRLPAPPKPRSTYGDMIGF